MTTDQILDHLEAVIAPTRVTDMWTLLGTTVAVVPAVIEDDKQGPIAHATGASKVDLIRWPDHTLVFLELG